VALTRAAWARCVAVPPGVDCQDEAGRLWDVLWLLRLAIGGSDGGPEVRFGVHVRNCNAERSPPLVRLKALCGPGDQGEPVITVMLLEEGASCHDTRGASPTNGVRRRSTRSTPGAGLTAGANRTRRARRRGEGVQASAAANGVAAA
jgi:hypothetical protein